MPASAAAQRGLDGKAAFIEAANALGLRTAEPTDESADVRVDVNGRWLAVDLKRFSTVGSDDVPRLVSRHRDPPDGEAPQLRVLVADRVLGEARDVLKAHGWGWLDLRGHLFLSAPGVLVDAEVPAFRPRPDRMSPFSGSVGLEVACALLLEPDVAPTVRGLARTLSRAPSTVSDVLKGLRSEALLLRAGTPATPELFWATAEAWPSRAVPLAASPAAVDSRYAAALRIGLDDFDSEAGWALTDTLAAAAYGAPVGARSDHPPDFHVPDEQTLRRAVQVLGQAETFDSRRASVRVAPVPAVCTNRVDLRSSNQPWPLTRPLFVALDLAADRDRGRQVLEAWQPRSPWHRVW
ncbi:hypothetical protein [Jiangella alba]|uniref:Transcriptional regulator n=1 Tax=Jiangella alba TaxID=561176 RepID=A0A1H5PEF4_9ACTN|nr:hypothetical protein [Jiangella alba]SEF11468.1 hypothetical protein SAMN04488561_4076 [Jiangella alba]